MWRIERRTRVVSDAHTCRKARNDVDVAVKNVLYAAVAALMSACNANNGAQGQGRGGYAWVVSRLSSLWWRRRLR